MIRTSPTPAERSSRGRTILSAISVSSRSARSPDTASVTTGAWSLSNLDTIGGRISRGRLRTAMATLSRTSWAATSICRLRAKVTMTMQVPGPEIERSSWMPWMVLICSSSRWATRVSTSSVEAPGSSTRTLTVGRSTAGKRSTPSRNQLAVPTTTNTMTSIVAKTGRLMQTSASFCMASRLLKQAPSAGGRRPRSPCLVGRERAGPTTVVGGDLDLAPARPPAERMSRGSPSGGASHLDPSERPASVSAFRSRERR